MGETHGRQMELERATDGVFYVHACKSLGDVALDESSKSTYH